MTTEEQRQAALKRVADKRGYVLNYHRLLAADDPELLEAYDRLYTRITLDTRSLNDRQKELVWLALLSAREEPTGRIHVDRGKAAGLSEDEMADALTLTSTGHCYRTLVFAASHWSKDIPDERMVERYLKVFEAARGSIDKPTAEIMGVITHASLRQFDAMPLHLERAFGAGVTPAQMREAFSFLLLPCGGNLFIHAVDAWEAASKARNLPAPH